MQSSKLLLEISAWRIHSEVNCQIAVGDSVVETFFAISELRSKTKRSLKANKISFI